MPQTHECKLLCDMKFNINKSTYSKAEATNVGYLGVCGCMQQEIEKEKMGE